MVMQHNNNNIIEPTKRYNNITKTLSGRYWHTTITTLLKHHNHDIYHRIIGIKLSH